jgi:hypothetical protein
MNFDNELVGIGGDDREGTIPFTRRRLLPILPDARNPPLWTAATIRGVTSRFFLCFEVPGALLKSSPPDQPRKAFA